jgi:hypothetical protein
MKLLNKIQQELKCNKAQKNNFGNYNYRSCEDILEAVKPLLGDGILTISDEILVLGGSGGDIVTEVKDKRGVTTEQIESSERFYIKATATIKCGEEEISCNGFARESFTKKGMDASQITGSTSSYARKYALNGLFCIDDTKDADTMDNRPKAPKKNFKDDLKATGSPLTEKIVFEYMKDYCQEQDKQFTYSCCKDFSDTQKSWILGRVDTIVDWDTKRKDK